ncbi:MAG: hypothetical protein GY849_17945, partial [Deltaproteobacteria bacterium]|nr:hypothetical protein [Deltaproteobacteria bacterium]
IKQMPKIEISEETLKKIKDQLGEDVKLKEINSMEELIGEISCFQCARYIYHGEVEKVNEEFIVLKNASIVFDTGSYDSDEPDDKQNLPNGVKVMRQSIESFFKLNW